MLFRGFVTFLTMEKLTHQQLSLLRLTEAESADAPRHPVIVVLENIRSRYNVGSIFRSADAFRIEQLVLTGYTPTPPSSEISKTALGSERTVPHRYVASAVDAVQELQTLGWNVYALELAQPAVALHMVATIPNNGKSCFPLAFVVGNELTGLTNEVLDMCNGAVYIPMYGVKHSLNVAVAAGIAMYQAVQLLP